MLVTRGTDHELSSVAFAIANGGITAGLKVAIFLTSAAVDLVRKRAVDTTVVNPLEPLVIDQETPRPRRPPLGLHALRQGPRLQQSDLIDGVEITGASKVHELIKTGAATLSF